MRILFLPKYSISGPSSRYRIYQYLQLFGSEDIEFTVLPLLDDEYISNLYNGNNNINLKLAYAYLKRFLKILLKRRDYDLIFLEKEFFPFMPDFIILFKLLGIKYIVDYDDAIFHNYDKSRSKLVRFFFQNKISNVIKNAEYVICGSPYLTNFAMKYSKNVIEIPTSINFQRYQQRRLVNSNKEKFVIGWIGSKTTSKHLLEIKDALLDFFLEIECEIHLIGFDENLINEFDKRIPVKLIKWNSETEIEEMCKFSVGVMPLPDQSFEQGKCGFKLVQYMACGLATISTPLEANVKIDNGNGNLFAVKKEGWVDAFKEMYLNREKYLEVGKKNIRTIKHLYSVESNVEKYVDTFKKCLVSKRSDI